MGLKCWILISYFVSVIQNHRIGTFMIYVVKPFLLVSLFFSHYGCRAIQKSNCYHKEGHEAACNFGNTNYVLLFGVVRIVLSQIPESLVLLDMLGHMCFSCYRTYVMILCNWLILWQNAFYLYFGRLRICFKYFKKPCFKIKCWSLQVCSRNQARVQIH